MFPQIAFKLRSWRVALVMSCLAATIVICAILAGEVHEADAALDRASSQTLHNYASYAGRVIGIELLRRSNDFRGRLFAPLNVTGSGPSIELDKFAAHGDSLYRADHYPADSLRGYLRIDVKRHTWAAAGATANAALAKRVVDTLVRQVTAGGGLMPMGIIILPVNGQAMTASYVMVREATTHDVFAYVVTGRRAVNFHHTISETLRQVPLLPTSLSGDQWNVDLTTNVPRPERNDSLIGVRVVGVDGVVLYQTPLWFSSPYHGSFQFQTGPGGFTIQTALRPSIEQQLMPASVRSTTRFLYIAFGLVGIFLVAVSIVAFRSEMAYQSAERERSMQQLTTGLRHELNNALASVMLESQLLAGGEGDEDAARAAGASISEQAERMRDVLKRLDNIDNLPVVNYFEGKSMIDLAAAPVPARPRSAARTTA